MNKKTKFRIGLLSTLAVAGIAGCSPLEAKVEEATIAPTKPAVTATFTPEPTEVPTLEPTVEPTEVPVELPGKLVTVDLYGRIFNVLKDEMVRDFSEFITGQDHPFFGSYNAYNPVLSEDGKMIATVVDPQISPLPSDYLVSVANVDGTTFNGVLENEFNTVFVNREQEYKFNNISNLTWSPNSQYLAFLYTYDSFNHDEAKKPVLMVVDFSKDRYREKIYQEIDLGEEIWGVNFINWSSDNKNLIFRGNLDKLVNVDISTGKVTKLIEDDSFIFVTYSNYSPDGTTILFSAAKEWIYYENSERDTIPDFGPFNLYSYDTMSKEITQLTFASNDYSPVAWSPDGETVLVEGTIWNDGEGEEKEGRIEREHIGNYLFLMNPDGSNFRRLSDEEVYIYTPNPVWSPDSQYIAMVPEPGKDEDKEIHIYDVEGNLVEEFFCSSGNYMKWLPDDTGESQ